MNPSGDRRQPGDANPRGRNGHSVREQAEHGPEPEAPADNGATVRAVIVDDSPSVLKTLTSLLEQQSDVQLIGSATDGYGAVRRVMELSPDLVLMDLQLPGINGLEATRQIKARSPAPAVILVTADDTPGCRAAARAAGTDGFVGKQHLFTRLRPAIRKLFPRKGNAGHRNQGD